MTSQYRRVPSGGRGHVQHSTYCAICHAIGRPVDGWWYWEGFAPGRRVYYCGPCGASLAAEEAAGAGEPLDVPADLDLDIGIDAQARAESRADLLGAGRLLASRRRPW